MNNFICSQKFNTALFLEEMESMQDVISSKIFEDLYLSTLSRRLKEKKLFDEYCADRLIICGKNNKDEFFQGVNSKINHDFRGDIVDSFTGYLFGNPVKYTIKPERYAKGKDDDKFKSDTAFFDEFNDLDSIDDVDVETGFYQSICGRGARLCYVSPEKTALGKPSYMVIALPAWECVFIYNPNNSELQYAARFYEVYDTDADGTLKIKIQAGYAGTLTYADQIVKVEPYRPEKRFGDGLKGLHLYGTKLVRPTAMAVLVVNRANLLSEPVETPAGN
jgi:hypothetical protein